MCQVLPSVSLEILTMATAAGASVLPSNASGKAKRKSYAREFKQTVTTTIMTRICTRRPIVEH